MLWPAVEKALAKAVQGLIKMRVREGRSLAKDTNKNLLKMKMHIRNILLRAKAILKENKKNLSVDEFLAFQKGSDINEESARLMHYIEEFQRLLKEGGSVGKKLDFIAQEMQRETNTIGSKVQDKMISGAVISLKSNIEKLREQAQNVE